MTDKFISELPTGTVDSLRASVPLELGMPTGTLTIQSSLAQVSQFLAQYGYQTGTYVSMRGYISENGAQMTYITGSSYQVEAGQAEVNGSLLSWSSPMIRTGLSLASGTMNYVYLWASGTSTPALEESTTAPVWDGTLNYFKKTGDNNRRCIGFLQTQNASVIRPFINVVRGRTTDFEYIDLDASGAKLLVNNAFITGSWTTMNMSSIVPIQTNEVLLINKLVLNTTADDGTLGINPVHPGNAASPATVLYQVRGRAGANGANIFFGNAWLSVIVPQTMYAKVLINAGNPAAQITVWGARFIR